jgi:hypothetical protein
MSLGLFAWAGCAPAPEPPAPEPAAVEPPPPEPPPRSDTITALSQFLACEGNPYALCYYSGPADAPAGTKVPVPALPCTLGEGGKVANCKCYAIDDPTSINFVALPSILDPKVREETETLCHEDGSGCINLTNMGDCAMSANPDPKTCKTPPVCRYLGDAVAGTNPTLYPDAALISTFSFKYSPRYPISSTDCSEQPYLRYAGCMTAPCSAPYMENGKSYTDCRCPTFVGPFQFGQMQDALVCDLGGDNVWSAANVTATMPTSGPGSDES